MQTRRQTIEIRNASNNSQEKVQLNGHVTQMALGWDHLVLTTATQLYVFSAKNWNTPTIVDLKDVAVSLIVLCNRYKPMCTPHSG